MLFGPFWVRGSPVAVCSSNEVLIIAKIKHLEGTDGKSFFIFWN